MHCIGASSGHSVRRDEFIEFAQFLTVMNFLTNTEEGQSVGDLRFDLMGVTAVLGLFLWQFVKGCRLDT